MFRTLLVALLLSTTAYAQVLTPAKISVSLAKTDLKVGDQVDVILSAVIDEGWYVYTNKYDCPPIPFTVEFKDMKGFQLVGDLRAIGDHKKFEESFECDVNVFEKKGEFRQTIKILSPSLKLEGSYAGQVCSNVCIPFDGDFKVAGFKVGGSAAVDNPDPGPEEVTETPIPKSIFKDVKGPTLDRAILDGKPTIESESFIGFLFLAFVLGLTSLITPCVFPMIPMTVTFFLRDNQSRKEGIRKAIIFGISIIAIYTLAGTLLAVAIGSDGLNALSTHWAPNLFVFAIFIVFALSFFGLFEINAPYQLVNKVDQQAEKGGLIGIFFMAATLVLVSFSCTIPIVGNVLVLAAGGEILKPILAMFFYSLAFAIPFAVFAFFPELIKSMPKSGGWLNSVKVTLGFLELALCLKFFSIADQAYHWGLLDRDLNIVLWIVIFTLMGVYFLGKLVLKGDTPVTTVGVPRLMLSIVTFSFVVWLIPGLFGAPLKGLAGYLPPMYTHDFNLASLKGSGAPCGGTAKYSEFLHLPHGLNGYFDYKEALACAREQHKPLFIDFTGHACTNCREMEAVVWSDPEVLKRLQNDFVVVALYVDDKTELAETEWYTAKDGKVKKTIGKQNADLQITNLDNNAQPFYILLGEDERVLAWPYAYETSIPEFVNFLESGKKKFKELYN